MTITNVFDALPASVELSDRLLEDAAANAGIGPQRKGNNVLLNEERSLIRQRARTYVRYSARKNAFRGTSRDRTHLTKIIKALKTTESELIDLVAENPTLARYVVWPEDLDILLGQLRTMGKAIHGHLENVEQGAVPAFPGLASFLLNLEPIYVRVSGNKSTAVTRKGKARKSAFCTFVWPILNAIRGSSPPHSEQALMATWEIVYGLRKKKKDGEPIQLRRPRKQRRNQIGESTPVTQR